MDFQKFFQKATECKRSPGGTACFPYQEKFATSPNVHQLVHAPTGAGKTATAILGWLWRFKHATPAIRTATPRRLVYCLPMRVLVEQTRDEARNWVQRLGLENEVRVHVLMGGEDVEGWDLDPEKPAILIGTQDMLLSRALNRGYGMSRYRWPMHYGLMNNDALWVLDEIQLMGTGLATSTQLQAFRETLGAYGPTKTVWMSATQLPKWLASVDYRDRIEPVLQLEKLALDPKMDYRAEGLRERWEAKKPIADSDLIADGNARRCAEFVKANHKEGSLTLVIVNTVDRCRAIFEALQIASPTKRPKESRSGDRAGANA